jgi:hypothetical protein
MPASLGLRSLTIFLFSRNLNTEGPDYFDQTTQGNRGSKVPDWCGDTWKLPDAAINQLASRAGAANSVFRLDCGVRTGFWQFSTLQGNKQVSNGFNAYSEKNKERYGACFCLVCFVKTLVFLGSRIVWL